MVIGALEVAHACVTHGKPQFPPSALLATATSGRPPDKERNGAVFVVLQEKPRAKLVVVARWGRAFVDCAVVNVRGAREFGS
jgi:hypothetical protein